MAVEGPYITRNPLWSCFSSADRVGFVSKEDDTARSFAGDKAKIALDLWNSAGRPSGSDRLRDSFSSIDPGDTNPTEILMQLLNDGALISSDTSLSSFLGCVDVEERTCDRLLVCMTGAIQTAIFFPFLLTLRAQFCRNLKIVLTASAEKLVRKSALFHLLHAEVYSDIFEESKQGFRVSHIELAEWASCILVAPATASTIHRIAHATCDDLISLTVSAAAATTPIILGPSMNSKMWENRAVQKNVSLCRDIGLWIIEPGVGYEVDTGWNERKPQLGVFGARPDTLVSSIRAICEFYKIP
jgi:phosphopantothenoylcysteine decarboxylase